MKKLLLFACLALFAGCPEPMPTPEDAGEEVPPPPYDGETAGGSIPELPMTTEPLLDAGVIVVDAGCCETRFRVSRGSEPDDAVGRIVSGLAVLSNLPLTLSGGEWTANACFPLTQSVAYRYEFRWDGGVEDGGSLDLEDGGTEWYPIVLESSLTRASSLEPSFTDINGEAWNFYRAVESCDGLDGSVP